MTSTRLGPYEIISLLGQGGMGAVYRARDTRLGRDVAIKVLPVEAAASPDRLRRFEQEARAIAALEHPNILAIHDVGSASVSPAALGERGREPGDPGGGHRPRPGPTETVHYLVTELLEGESLRSRLGDGPLPVRKAVEIAVQIARGLAAAHEKGIIHRDLKPGNVFLAGDGHVKILDFGLAKLAAPTSAELRGEATTADEVTEAGAVLGSMGYMSPEQVRGQVADQRADIFAFGCVLYEMIVGRRAFAGNSGPETMSAILYDDPDGLESSAAALSPALCGIVRRCLEKRPEDRFSMARDLAFALEAIGGNGSGAVRVRQRRIGRRWLSRRFAPIAVALAVLGVGGLWLVLRQGPRPLPQFHPHRISGGLGNISDACVSPGGNEVAYASGEGVISDVWVTDFRGGRPIRLTDGTTRAFGPAWFPDGGAVAFSADRGGGMSIWKVPRFGGAPMLLMANAQDPAISSNGRRMAFARPDGEGVLRLWVADVGVAESARQLTTSEVGIWDHRHPAWSPDGRTICFHDVRNLFLIPAAGGAARPLTVGDDYNSSPTWSTDGRHVYFASIRDGVRALWRIAVDGGATVRLTQGAGDEASPTLSRDGRRLVFVAGPTIHTVALVDMQTGKVARLQAGRSANYPSIAPDRSAIVFESDLAGFSDLWWQELRDNAPVGEPARLTDHPGESVVPAFSPDGRWIAYYRVVEGERDIYVVPAHGGTPVDVTSRGGINIEPAWSPDGKQIAFISDRGGSEQVWVLPFADGHSNGEARRVTDEQGTASYPAWSPDGRSIAYVLTAAADSEVRVAAADGSASRAVTAGAQARMVRWWWAKDLLVVSGRWGRPLPSIRLVAPDGGASEPLAIPAPVAVDPDYPDFEWSRDGHLLGLFQQTKEAELWALEVEQGTF